jgi:hypothetical protein
VEWRALTAVSNCTVEEENWLVIPPNVREAVFEGLTNPESHPIDARESSITVELRKCEQQNGGES